MKLEYSAIEAMADIVSADSSTSVVEHFRAFAGQFHIDTFTSGEVDIKNRKRSVFHAMEWPEKWQKFYFQSGMIDHDPLVEALATQPNVFTWDELRRQRGLSMAGTEALNKVAAEGWKDGLVVSLHRSGSHYGLVSLVTLNHHLDATEKIHLAAVSIVFHDRMRTLVPREGFRVPPCGLTPRELDCIGLIAKGLSDRKAGEALGISGSTVHEHAERAKRKMDAGNRAELVALATAYGIIAA